MKLFILKNFSPFKKSKQQKIYTLYIKDKMAAIRKEQNRMAIHLVPGFETSGRNL
jgi:hypothetical protein